MQASIKPAAVDEPDMRSHKSIKHWAFPGIRMLLCLGWFTLLTGGPIYGHEEKASAEKVMAAGIGSSDVLESGVFSAKLHGDGRLLVLKFQTSAGKSQPLSDPCIIREAHQGFADRGPDPAILGFHGQLFGYPSYVKSLICCLPFTLFSSWTGNSAKIRPPPAS